MHFDKFLKAAAQRHPAIVLQVSWANGLDIIRDLATADVPLLAIDDNPRALGLHSRLAAGMVCTVEPGIYLEGDAGVRVEDTVLVTAEGCVRLTLYPKELQIVG